MDVLHDGVIEKRFFDRLIALNYYGIVVFDDTLLNDGMKEFWKYVTGILKCDKNRSLISYDATNIGHFTGTGMVFFNPDSKMLEILWELV